MAEKFNNKYRISSARLRSWDYSADGKYFITICTKNRRHFFGEIVDHKMILNETGKIADKFWRAIPAHFQFVKLDEYVVMPNHVHGIIIIDKPPLSVNDGTVGAVETGHDLSLPVPQPPEPQQSVPSKPSHFRFRNQGKKYRIRDGRIIQIGRYAGNKIV